MGGMLLPAIGIAVIILMMVFTSRSQKKQEREAAEMRNNLVVGDEITTIGGIVGRIVSIKDETMVIETTRDHTRIRFLKSAVRSVDVHAEDAAPAPKAKPATTAAKKPAAKKPAAKKPAAEVAAPAEEPAAAPEEKQD